MPKKPEVLVALKIDKNRILKNVRLFETPFGPKTYSTASSRTSGPELAPRLRVQGKGFYIIVVNREYESDCGVRSGPTARAYE